ncbi:ankyrin repeat domain-containing protein [Humitalea rosea]|uniref:ankyrin repeat domain-containing protein n=1 Tax=Humitalea rosea TaxID=990373 RepID=UPI000DADB857|nr:ankyrin repeat domain-containing protein [Humitalea rosea]
MLPVLAAATPAFAQPEGPGIIRPNQAPAAANAPPPALPGLAARPAPAPIAPEAGAALGPNASLFDAINRGDIAAARDAVGRGADLGSRNLLGLTPIDAAVDQGRTEIAFYLLAARGTAQPSRAPATASIARPPGRGAPLATPPAARGPATPAAVMQPKLWADDGGTPRPEAGFLGFDAGRPAGAQPPPAAARRTRG